MDEMSDTNGTAEAELVPLNVTVVESNVTVAESNLTVVQSNDTTFVQPSNITDITKEDDSGGKELNDFIICLIVGSAVVAIVAVMLFLLVKRIRDKRRAPDQYQLLKDDVKTLNATPIAKKAIRKPGVSSDSSLGEMARLWQSD